MIWNEVKSLELFLTLIWNANRAPTAVKINEWATPDCLSFHWMASHSESICAKQTILQHCGWCWREKNFAAVGLKGQICGSQFLCSYVTENSSWERQLSSGRYFFLLKKIYFNCEILLYQTCRPLYFFWECFAAHLKITKLGPQLP